MRRLFLGAAIAMLLLPSVMKAQTGQINQTVQTVRGQVCDVASGEPMIGVTITVENGITLATVSDVDGNFVINNVPVGRHSVRATYIGYEPVLLKEQLVSSGKELVLTLRMRESISELGEVVIKPRVNKQQPLNEMAQVGARMFSVEEATRYAGGMADPARTASMFAGVATGGATNGISIHGNSPQMLQWRVEGVEVPNPNHFAEITEAGGGVFTSLNGTVLANSDFLTGAMPAEFGNALSGAFDMKMRVGNNTKYEHAVQVGTLGVDFASEGPLGKNTKASYLVNYRYSFLEIAKKLHAINMENETLDYQDLSFKLNMPTKKAGTFAVWFTGLIDNYENKVPEVSEWETLWDMNDSWSRQRNCAVGLNHSYRFRSGGSLHSSVAFTGSYRKLGVNDYDTKMNMMPEMAGRNSQWNVIISTQHQHKFSSRYTMQNGFEHQHLDFHTWMDYIHETGGPLYRVYDSEGNTGLTRLYTNHKVALSSRLSTVAGVNVMWFNLNNQWLVEPRISLQYKTSPSSTLSVAYAMNSRKETTDTYFVLMDGKYPNEDLGLTRSHHISASFAQRLGENAMLKIEPYWQWLFDVPVEQGTTYSILNHRKFFQDRALVNEGAGRNYGVDLTLERYLKDGLYGMITATLFKSEYRDAQGQWHHSRHDHRYITNILGGKEWMIGKARKNVFGINGRLTMMGGDRYTPIPEGITFEKVMKRPDKSIPEDEGMDPFTKQKGMNIGYAFSVKYTINKRHTSHHFILEYLQMKTFQGQTFDLRTHEIVDKFTSLTFPNIAYRVEF
ncbi:MAG: carboxypeptidase-like regulatory domain-containing protein [Prevotella sp.]|nr:carboxypeptidase-like regulatory domain-containing protein [Prevotella sp.]